MGQKKLSTILNFSNQANYNQANYTDLYQYNIVAIVGESYLNTNGCIGTKIPLSINVNKSGELEINTLAGEKISNGNNINIYSDVKVSNNKE